MPPPKSCFGEGILIKSSITAEKKKQATQIHSTGLSPQALYKTPPKAGPSREAMELMEPIMELASIKRSWLTSAGMLACTEG